jgi:hypothetical protein
MKGQKVPDRGVVPHCSEAPAGMVAHFGDLGRYVSRRPGHEHATVSRVPFQAGGVALAVRSAMNSWRWRRRVVFTPLRGDKASSEV